MPNYKNRKCYFCEEKIDYIDYKNTRLLRKGLTKYMKIVPKYYSGICISHQKRLARAIKNAREMALIPYTIQ